MQIITLENITQAVINHGDRGQSHPRLYEIYTSLVNHLPDFSPCFPKMARQACASRLLEKSSKKQSVMQARLSRTLFCSMPLDPKMAQACEKSGSWLSGEKVAQDTKMRFPKPASLDVSFT